MKGDKRERKRTCSALAPAFAKFFLNRLFRSVLRGFYLKRRGPRGIVLFPNSQKKKVGLGAWKGRRVGTELEPEPELERSCEPAKPCAFVRSPLPFSLRSFHRSLAFLLIILLSFFFFSSF